MEKINMKTYIKCRMCKNPNANIIFRDGRNMEDCTTCGYVGYLKEHNFSKSKTPANLMKQGFIECFINQGLSVEAAENKFKLFKI